MTINNIFEWDGGLCRSKSSWEWADRNVAHPPHRLSRVDFCKENEEPDVWFARLKIENLNQDLSLTK